MLKLQHYFTYIYNDKVNNSLQSFSSRLLAGWMIVIIVSNTILSYNNSNNNSTFFRIGIHDDFIILGYVIDKYWKYSIVIAYCCINCVIRKVSHDILYPWLNNNIFDISYIKYKKNNKLSYEITTVATLYTWFDWFLNFNLLMSQIDIFCTELIIDVIISNIVTKYYLSHNNNDNNVNNANNYNNVNNANNANNVNNANNDTNGDNDINGDNGTNGDNNYIDSSYNDSSYNDNISMLNIRLILK